MIQFGPRSLDRHIPEKTVVHTHYIFHPVLHLYPQPDHNSLPPLSVSGSLARKKVHQHILQSCRRQVRHNILVLIQSFRSLYFVVEFTSHQKFGPVGALSKICDNVLNSLGIIWGKVASRNIPLLPFRIQLKSEVVRPKLLKRLD